MKNLLSILIILICSSAYTQTDSTEYQMGFLKKQTFYTDSVKITPTPQEVQVDTTNGIKTRVINNKVYYMRETQKITIKHEKKD